MPELEIAKRSRESLLRLTTALLEAELASLRQMMPGSTVPATNKEEKKMAERTIFINQSGPMTHALLVEGGQVIKVAEAKCGPDDTFDLAIGAKLALERLFDEGKKEVQKPIKLYCVKDYEPGVWVTKGKVYEISSDGIITFDDGYSVKWDSLPKPNSMTDLLIPLVSRPAKVGEWVMATVGGGYEKEHGLIEGEIYRIDGFEVLPIVNTKVDRCPIFDYLVLDDYQPEPEKPKYYSGKAVCVKEHFFFTPGRVYEFKEGVVIDDNGNKRPNEGRDPIENLDSHWAKGTFIEFKE